MTANLPVRKDVHQSKDEGALYPLLIDILTEPILVIQDDGLIQFANPAAAQWFQCQVSDLIGRRFDYPVEPGVETEITLDRPEGEDLHALMCPVKTIWLDRVVYLVSLVDITHRKRTELFLGIQHELAYRLGATNDLQEAFKMILEASLEMDGIDCGAIYLVNPNTGAVTLAAQQGLSDDFVLATSYFDGDSEVARLAQAGKPLWFSHMGPSRPPLKEFEAIEVEGLRSTVVLPVLNKDRVVAVMNLGSHTDFEISATCREMLEIISTRIGGVLDRLESSAALHAVQQKFHQFVNQSHDGIVIVNQDGVIVEWNQGQELITGRKSSETLGKFVWDVQHESAPAHFQTPEHLQKYKNTALEALKTGKGAWLNQLRETNLVDTLGNTHIIQALSFVIETDSGNIIGTISRDVTESRYLARLVEQGKKEWEATFNAFSDTIILADVEGIIIRCNQAALEKLQTPFGGLLGKPAALLFDGDFQKKAALGFSGETSLKNVEGAFIVSSYPVHMDNELFGHVYVIKDMTETNPRS